jgi:hypothetical protein
VRRFLLLAALILLFAECVSAASPGVNSISPSVLFSDASPQTVTITGHDFSPGAQVCLSSTESERYGLRGDQVTVVSSTTITFQVTLQTASTRSWFVGVAAPPFSCNVSNVLLEMRPQLSDLTPVIFENGEEFDSGFVGIVHARVTPHSTAYLLYLGTSPQLVFGKNVASDDDGDGVVQFDLDTPFSEAIFYVVDSAGLIRRATPGVPAAPPPVAAPDIEVGPDGLMSRVVAETSSTYVLWVRPGTGAWLAGASDNSPPSDQDVPFRNGRINVLTSIFKPFGSSVPPPDVFTPSDIVVLLGQTYIGNSLFESSGILPSPLTGTPGGGSIRVTPPVVISEGKSATVYLERWGGASGSISVSYRLVDGTAIDGANYVPATGSVTFASGEYVKPISISTIDDGFYDHQTFITLDMMPHGTSNDATTTAQIFVANVDAKPVMSISDVRVNEGDFGSHTVYVPVTLSGRTHLPASAGWFINDGSQSHGTLQFAVGETSKSIPVTYNADTFPGPDRQITIGLNVGEDASPFRNFATVTIVDDDTQTLSVNDIQAEEQSQTATFLVTMSRTVLAPVTVHYATFDGTATAGADYTSTSGVLTFAPGEIAKTITVPVVQDQIADAGETFTLRLSDAAGATIAKSIGTATIMESGRLPPPVVLIDSFAIAEGNSGTTDATFNVRLSFASVLPVLLAWKTENGSAHDDSDYIAGNGTLTFAPGETALPVTVKISGDTTPEANETFRIVIIAASNAIVGDGATCTIVDDDKAVVPPRHRAAGH